MSRSRARGHLGLGTLRERADALGANLSVGAARDRERR
jgi:hypothetical protein